MNNENFGTFTDPRDGKVYKTVKIGNQVWMAENLNYECAGSWCYGNDPENAKKYGRLYTFDNAIENAPKGWHLPSKAEFKTLGYSVGGMNCANNLKAKTGWIIGENGIDDFGFSAIPSGYKLWTGKYLNIGKLAGFWTSDSLNFYKAYCVTLYATHKDVFIDENHKSNGLSVRYVKDIE